MRCRPSRGLTLLEVLATVAVLAVLTSLALPPLGALAERRQLAAAAEGLAADLAEARFEAARSGQVLHLQSLAAAPPHQEAGANTGSKAASNAGAQGGWCWAVATQPGCDCTAQVAPACRLKAVRAADHPGVKIAQGFALQIDPTGTVHGSAPAAELQSRQGDRLRIESSALGRSRICVPQTIGARSAWPDARHAAC